MKKEFRWKSITLTSLRKKIRHISSSLLYAGLLMYYAFMRSETPAWAKRIIMGVFVYLFAPIDAVPDLTPVIGYTDDMGVMLYGLVLIAAYINDEVRQSARHTLETWIGPVEPEILRKVDERL